MSLSARRAWIEICVLVVQVLFDGSLSARRAWIEIAAAGALSRPRAVALRKESVDRNMGRPRPDFAGRWSLSARRAWIEMLIEKIAPALVTVALRKESVDRNCDLGWPCQLCAGVALRKESVDRNFSFSFIAASRFSSLSARRAWIEMSVTGNWLTAYRVALRKESVECFSF